MKRIWKKIMAILMAVFLVCTTLMLAGGAEAVSALAEADGNTPEVTDGADAQQFADNSGDIIIGNISIELDQLIKNHYMVTVPVTMPNNPGFTVLQFGVKWDVTRMSVQGARSTGDMKLPILTIANDKRQIWMMFIENDCKETNISSLTAEINPDVKVGDTFVLEGAYADYADNKALYKDKTMKSHDLNIVSGTITIVDSVVPEVKLQIGEVRPSMRDLDENDYMVEVPVTAEANNGFSDMVFGFRWDASKVTAEPPSGNIPEGLSLIPTIDNQNGVGWIHVIADSTYTGSDICTLRFTVPDNTKPGSIYDITGCSSDGDTEASVANHSGTAGTLTINNGRIFATSTQAANSFAFGKVTIPDISISMEDLEQSDHLISVPITITSNSCFTMLAFGVSWDTNDLSIVSCTCDDTKNLGMIESYSDDNNGIWMQFLYRGPYDAFTGTALCTLTFRVRSDISLGDKIMLNPQELSPDGDSMIIVSTKGTFGDLNMQKGTISLVSANELTAAATVKISDVEIDTYHLWLKSYVVDVPIVLKRNTGVSYLSMGVFYDETIAQAKELQSVNIDQIGVMDDFSQRSGEVVSSGWLEFRSVDPSSGYVYSGTTLGVLKIKLDESVKAGDVIDLSAVSLSPTGAVATVEIADGSRSSPALVSGSIRITEAATTTPAETTTSAEQTTETETTVTTTAATEETTISETETTTVTETTSAETTTETTTETTETTTEETTTETVTETTVTSTETTAATTTGHTAAIKTDHLNRTTLRVRAGQTSRLQFYPAEGNGDDCVWMSSDTDIVKLAPGNTSAEIMLTCNRVGTAEVSVLYDGQVHTCSVSVVSGDSEAAGDVNVDNQTDLSDLVMLNHMLLGQIPTGDAASQSADINGDGYLDNCDVLLLMQMLLNQGLLQ